MRPWRSGGLLALLCLSIRRSGIFGRTSSAVVGTGFPCTSGTRLDERLFLPPAAAGTPQATRRFEGALANDSSWCTKRFKSHKFLSNFFKQAPISISIIGSTDDTEVHVALRPVLISTNLCLPSCSDLQDGESSVTTGSSKVSPAQPQPQKISQKIPQLLGVCMSGQTNLTLYHFDAWKNKHQ